MGYTHYWTQRRTMKADEWQQATEATRAICSYVQHKLGVALANGAGDGGTQPAIEADFICLNGVEADSYETLEIVRKRRPAQYKGATPGWDCCKTGERPYDAAVTAILSYLDSVLGTHAVTSDGDARDWLLGVAIARKAIPADANQIDIPMSILKAGRWDYRASLGSIYSRRYDLALCVDGFVYAYDVKDESRCYRFDSVADAQSYIARNASVLRPAGSFQPSKLGARQTALLGRLVDAGEISGRNIRPIEYVRPAEMFPDLP